MEAIIRGSSRNEQTSVEYLEARNEGRRRFVRAKTYGETDTKNGEIS
jgi:hypothetical protein